MNRDDNNTIDASHDELILNCLEANASPREERRFRSLLADEAFRRRVAQFAIDSGHLYDLGRQGMLGSVGIDAEAAVRRPGPRTLTVAALPAAVVLILSAVWLVSRNWQEPTAPMAPSPLPSRLEPSGTTDRAPRETVHVVHVVGEVARADRIGAPEHQHVTTAMDLRAGEVLRTLGPDSFALLEFDDKTVLAVSGDTELLCAVDGGRKRVVVTAGDLVAQVATQPEAMPMVIETPVAEAEVLGTKLSLFTDSETTELAVLEGEVRMRRRPGGQFVDVEAGERVTASKDSDMAAKHVAPCFSLWEEDFEDGLPRRWRAGRWVHESLPFGSFGAVQATSRQEEQDDPDGPFSIATPRLWVLGLFRVEEDAHLNITYKLQSRGRFHIRLHTHVDSLYARDADVYAYRNRALWHFPRDRWRTVSVPLADFRAVDPNLPGRVTQVAPETGALVFMIAFGSPDRDSGLVVDRIWVTRGAPESAEVLGETN